MGRSGEGWEGGRGREWMREGMRGGEGRGGREGESTVNLRGK